MEKEFVPYPLALRLKALGFDEPCFHLDGLGKVSYAEFGYGATPIPLYSQAFRWFREKYNLNHVITVADFGKYESGNPDFQCAIYSKDPLLITNMYKYNTYEEAELACLQKLIELVKK
jgi:hypothetical protein